MVVALDFQPEARWLEAWSLPSFCFLRQETLLCIVSFNPGVQMGTCDGLASKPGGSSNTPSCFMLQKMCSALAVWATCGSCATLPLPCGPENLICKKQ